MQIDIFNVEHGSCALITADNGNHILIDCGHNSTTGWRPSRHLERLGVTRIEQLIITNCDRDHASDLPNIAARFPIYILRKNPTITEANLRLIKGVNMSPGIDALATMIGNYNAQAPEIDFAGINLATFWNEYPTDFQDENNLSMIVILTYGNFGICFPGDMEEPGWLNLARTTNLLHRISDVDVLVAAHHGRDNGRCELLYTHRGWRPQVTIISDSGIEHATQETVGWYRQRSRGIQWDDGTVRSVLTTRSDGAMRIVVQPNGNWRLTTDL
jgi:beta-lactamase superfamily II metal-dependent hydrolase